MTARVIDAVRADGRITVLAGLVGVVVLAWLALLRGAGLEMGAMGMAGGPAMPMAPRWTPGYAALVLGMWAIMMAAMMLPSAAPALFLVAGPAGNGAPQGSGAVAAVAFTAGYLAPWLGFSVAATLGQWELDRGGVLSQALASRDAAVAGLLLLAAGLYQWTPLKRACLRRCRPTAASLAQASGAGARAPTRAGVRHGLASLGCCWALMGLLFVGGVMNVAMNVAWIAGLALLALIEPAASSRGRLDRVIGTALVAWGVVVLVAAVL